MFRQFADTMLELYRLHQVQRLRVATRRTVGRMDDANPAAEVMDDGTTLVATGSMLAVMQHAQNERVAVESTDGAQTTDNGGTQVFNSTNPVRPDGSTDLIDRDFFRDRRHEERAARELIRERGRQERAGMPTTPEQWVARQQNLERLEAMSTQLGMPLEQETLSVLSEQRVQQMLQDFEIATRDYGLPPVQQGQYEAVASQVVSPNGVQNGAQADAFLGGLERRAQLRQEAADLAAFDAAQAAAKNGEAPWIDPDHMVEATQPDVADLRSQLSTVTDCAPLLTDAQVVEQAGKMHAAGIHPQPVARGADAVEVWEKWAAENRPDLPVSQASLDNYGGPGRQPSWASDPKDPRNWDTALDPISPKQMARLVESGLSAEDIVRLNGKGEASIVVGEYLGPVNSKPDGARAKAALDRVLNEAVSASPGLDSGQARQATLPSQTTTPTATATPKPTPKPLRPTQ